VCDSLQSHLPSPHELANVPLSQRWEIVIGASQVPFGMQAALKKHEPFLHVAGQSAGHEAVVSPQSQILFPHEVTNALPSHTDPVVAGLHALVG
jgi:hypothetical protein